MPYYNKGRDVCYPDIRYVLQIPISPLLGWVRRLWRYVNIDVCKSVYTEHSMKRAHHYGDVIMGAMASQITCLTIVYSTLYSGADCELFVRRIHRWSMNSTHKGSVTQNMFPFDDVIMVWIVFRLKSRMCYKLAICEPQINCENRDYFFMMLQRTSISGMI